jgi:hypothetical protein
VASADCLKRDDRNDRKDNHKERNNIHRKEGRHLQAPSLRSALDWMMRWVNHAMSFAMVLAIFAVFAVELRWRLRISRLLNDGDYCPGTDDPLSIAMLRES